MADFINLRIPDTVIGLGAINSIGNVVKEFAPTKILVVTDLGIIKAGIIDAIKSPLENAGCKFDIFDSCETEPSISAIEALGQQVKTGKYDLLIGFGGGSVMDATKVVSIIAANDGINVYDLVSGKVAEKTIPKILIPTTAGTGSEWSTAAVVSDDKAGKMTKLIITPQNYPDAVIIDPELTVNLPKKVTADTGIDALTHAIDNFTSIEANIMTEIFRGTAIRLIAENLPLVYARGNNLEARYKMSVAASFAMCSGGKPSLALVHFLGEPLGKKAHITHGMTCALLLPHVMEFNLISNPGKFAKVAELMGEEVRGLSLLDAAAKSVEAVRRLIREIGLPQSLKEASYVTITDLEIREMVEEIHTKHKINPRDVSPEDIAQIIALAIRGGG